jgi:putative chitinase
MGELTLDALVELTRAKNRSNAASLHKGLQLLGETVGLTRPHRLVPMLAQVGHESLDFKYDQEIWGPTPAQKRYDTRTDLGNTKMVDGDGYKNRGRGPLQVTGGYNIARYQDWCEDLAGVIGLAVPDFRSNPDLINTDPWEGLSVMWFWSTNGLNKFADKGDLVGLSKRINGGTNGLADRLARWDQLALRYLGYGYVVPYQRAKGLVADGVIGPKTRASLQASLVAAPEVSF